MEGAGQASVCGKRRGVCEGRHGGVKRERKDEMDEAVECSNCATPVDGMRAKCLECATILCPECDEKGIHGQHVMVRSDRTRFFNRVSILLWKLIHRFGNPKERDDAQT